MRRSKETWMKSFLKDSFMKIGFPSGDVVINV